MRDNLSTLVLVGGRGTRIASLHPECPKPMIPVKGRPFLDWFTASLCAQGLQNFLFATGHMAQSIENWAALPWPGITRQCHRETTPLGTGGAILNALPLCDEWILILNGDCLLATDITAMLARRTCTETDGFIVGVWMEDTSRYGSLITEGNRLTAFREKQPGKGLINAGIYLLRKQTLQSIPWQGQALSMETDIMPALLKAGAHIHVHAVDKAPFIDIGTPETLAEAETFIEAHATWSQHLPHEEDR